MKEVYVGVKSPVHEAMLYIPGDGRQHVKAGVMVEECCNEINHIYLIGMAVVENISQGNAKIRLQTELAQMHHNGYAALYDVGSRHGRLQDQEKLGKATNVPSFNSQSGISVKPGTPEYEKYIEQKRVAGLKQTPLDKDEGLQLSRYKKIGDFNKSEKHDIRSVDDRPADQLFKNNFREF